MVKNLPANAGDLGLVPGLGRSPGEGNGNPLQYCLDNPMDTGGYSSGSCKESGKPLFCMFLSLHLFICLFQSLPTSLVCFYRTKHSDSVIPYWPQ